MEISVKEFNIKMKDFIICRKKKQQGSDLPSLFFMKDFQWKLKKQGKTEQGNRNCP
jgi:hypothetical protein